MGEMRVLNQHGDEKLEWDPADKASVAAAKKKFATLKKDGYRFYEVQETADASKPVDRFSAKLGRVIAAPGARSAADKTQGRRTSAMAGGPNATSRPLR